MTAGPQRVRTSSGTPVHVSGAGPVTLILIHGVLVDHRMWHRQVDALSGKARICCLDMLGHGDAPDPPGERTLEDFVAQALEVVDLFSDQGAPILGGFSMGGLISQAFAARHHDRLSGLIILNAVYDRSPEEARIVWERFKGKIYNLEKIEDFPGIFSGVGGGLAAGTKGLGGMSITK